jgi:RNA polymerase sigma factor (TIGR02999 family)
MTTTEGKSPAQSDDDEGVQAVVLELLEQYRAGDPSAFDRLFPLVYDEMREIAHRHRRHWKGDETIGTTVLVHEAYLKLAGQRSPQWQNRTHLLAVASRAMRQILLDYAKARRAGKRGGGMERVSLDFVADTRSAWADLSLERAETFIALDRSLRRLEAESERHCRIVECRFFGGMTIEETAEALGVSPATVKRGWAHAQAWLHRDMRDSFED